MQINLNVAKSDIPHVQHWIGPWAMHEPHFHATREQLSNLNMSLHLSNATENREQALSRQGESNVQSTAGKNIAVINVCGTLMKQASSFSSSCSTVMLRQQIRDLSKDGNVHGIMLVIESPGGTVAGTRELAQEITKAKESKPVWAYCEDLTASAAYWIASQCDRVEANSTSLVGSIGTYCVVTDSSAAAEKAGFTVHVIRAGEFKGAGTPGTQITEQHIEQASGQVQKLNSFFLDAVQTGRNLSKERVSEIADGRVHVASEAKSMGLIDDVSSFEDYLNRFFVSLGTPARPASQQRGEKIMSAETATQTPATIAQLKAEFPKATSDWILSCIESGHTVEQARIGYCQILQAKADAAEQRANELEKASKANRPGAKPLSVKPRSDRPRNEDMPVDDEDEEEEDEDAEPDASSVDRWNSLVSSYERKGFSKSESVKRANRSNPKLRLAMLAYTNRNRSFASQKIREEAASL